MLVLCPSPLVEQWAEELHAKFNLDFVVFDDPKFQQDPGPWSSFDRIVASLDTVKREPHRSAVLASFFDCVIVDEAHRCRNRSTLNWTFVSELKKKYILLLTATPIQNSLEELYNLITLLRPGQLETPSAFARKYISSGDRLKPRNVEQLRALTREVMIRNKRSSCGVPLPKRRADTISVRLTSGEASLYQEITGYVRREYLLHQRSASMQMVLKTLQREIGSSVHAVSPTLARLDEDDPRRQKMAEKLAATRADHQKRRQDIAEKFKPRVECWLDSATVYILPKVKLIAEVQHKSLAAPLELYYNVAANQLELPACPSCGQLFSVVHIAKNGTALCPDCGAKNAAGKTANI